MKPAAESDKPMDVSWNHTVYRVKKKCKLLVINMNCLHQTRTPNTLKIWGSHSNVAIDSCLLGCHTMSVGKYWLVFWRRTVPSSSRSAILLEMLDHKDEGTTVLQNVRRLRPAQWHSATSHTTWILEGQHSLQNHSVKMIQQWTMTTSIWGLILKVGTMHAMKAYRRRSGITPLVLNLSTTCSSLAKFTSQLL